jgi:hypothetical protein
MEHQYAPNTSNTSTSIQSGFPSNLVQNHQKAKKRLKQLVEAKKAQNLGLVLLDSQLLAAVRVVMARMLQDKQMPPMLR